MNLISMQLKFCAENINEKRFVIKCAQSFIIKNFDFVAFKPAVIGLEPEVKISHTIALDQVRKVLAVM